MCAYSLYRHGMVLSARLFGEEGTGSVRRVASPSLWLYRTETHRVREEEDCDKGNGWVDEPD